MGAQQNVIQRLQSNYNIQGAVQMAVVAVALVDKDSVIQFDAHDLPGTLARLLAAAPNDVRELQGATDPTADNEPATLSTNLTGDDNDLVFTAVGVGTSGNAVTVEYIDPGANDVALSVAVVGNAIQVTLETDGTGEILTTADDIAAQAAEFAAQATVADKAANDGSGVVTAMAATPLAGGEDATGVGTAGPGSRYTNYADGTLWINTGTKAAPVWAELAPA